MWMRRWAGLARLRDLGRTDAAMESYRQILTQSDSAEAANGLAEMLYSQGAIEDAFGMFRARAGRAHGPAGSPLPAPSPNPPHRAKHDREQAAHLAGLLDRPAQGLSFYLDAGARVSGDAVNRDIPRQEIERQWQTQRPQIIVVDDLLTPEALAALRRFCEASTIWQKTYDAGYLGATPETGFACPLLAQIAEEFPRALPEVFRAHPLKYLWAFKYDSTLAGINIHADFAAVNVNFWITPDEANLDPESGGLVVWDKAAPLDWDFDKYNTDESAIRRFLDRCGRQACHHSLSRQPGGDLRLRPVSRNRPAVIPGGLSEPPHQRHPALWRARKAGVRAADPRLKPEASGVKIAAQTTRTESRWERFMPVSPSARKAAIGLLLFLAAPALAVTYKHSDVPYQGPRVPIPMTPERQAMLDATQKEYEREQAVLGIRGKLREITDSHSPVDAPNAPNYDEAASAPYPYTSDVLRMKDGKETKTAEEWWKLRRPQIVEAFDREIFGRAPKHDAQSRLVGGADGERRSWAAMTPSRAA